MGKRLRICEKIERKEDCVLQINLPNITKRLHFLEGSREGIQATTTNSNKHTHSHRFRSVVVVVSGDRSLARSQVKLKEESGTFGQVDKCCTVRVVV